MKIFTNFLHDQARVSRMLKLIRWLAWGELVMFVIGFFVARANGATFTQGLQDAFCVFMMALSIFACDFGLWCSKRIQEDEEELKRLDCEP